MVFDPGLDCRLTMKLHEARWLQALDAALAACRFGRELEGDVLRVATLARLREEATARSLPSILTVYNNQLYFQANGGEGGGRELWRFKGP